MRDLLWYGFQILIWVVALMSGILSLARELLVIYRGDQAQPRSLFWNCTIIAFVFSATALWILEHQKVLETENKLREALPKSIPNLSGDVEFISIVPKEQGVIVAIFANIKNDGAPSIANIGQIKVVLPGGKQVETVTLSVPYNGIALKSPQGPTAMFPRQDYLPIKALSQPIATGGAVIGWTWGLARNIALQEINDPSSIISLAFTDVKGKPYEARRNIRDGKVEVVDPDALQDINPYTVFKLTHYPCHGTYRTHC